MWTTAKAESKQMRISIIFVQYITYYVYKVFIAYVRCKYWYLVDERNFTIGTQSILKKRVTMVPLTSNDIVLHDAEVSVINKIYIHKE